MSSDTDDGLSVARGGSRCPMRRPPERGPTSLAPSTRTRRAHPHDPRPLGSERAPPPQPPACSSCFPARDPQFPLELSRPAGCLLQASAGAALRDYQGFRPSRDCETVVVEATHRHRAFFWRDLVGSGRAVRRARYSLDRVRLRPFTHPEAVAGGIPWRRGDRGLRVRRGAEGCRPRAAPGSGERCSPLRV